MRNTCKKIFQARFMRVSVHLLVECGYLSGCVVGNRRIDV